METIVDLIVSNGMSVVLVAYFIFKDYKFNQQTIAVLGEIKEVLTCLKSWHDKDNGGE